MAGGTDEAKTFPLKTVGRIHLVYDPQGDYKQTFNGRDHGFAGAIVVKGGTLESASSNTFALVSRLDIRNGATFASNSTKTRSLAGVQRAILVGTAKLSVNVTSAEELFGAAPETVLEMGDNAQLDFAADVTVAKCFTNGVALAAGTYEAADLPQLKGEGRLVVTATAEVCPTLVPSISAAGKGYVDIGLEGTSGLKAEMDMSWQSVAGSTCFLGARKGAGKTMIQFLGDEAGSSAGVQLCYGNNYYYGATHAHFTPNQRYKVVTVLTNGCQTLRTYLWDGAKFGNEPDENLKVDAAKTGDVKSGYNLHVLSANAANSAASSSRATATCYSVKLYRWIAGEWVLVRDLKPAIKDGGCGLWDEVDRVFYPSTGHVFVTDATWTGAGDGRRFSDSANWSGGFVPYAGRVKFDLSSAAQTVENDVEGITFYDIEAVGANKLKLTGQEIVLTAGKNAFSNNCPIHISTPLTFTTDGAEMWIGDINHDVVVDGAIQATSGGTFTLGRIGCHYHTVFNGPISVPNGRLNVPLQGNGYDSIAYFNAKITCHELWLPGRNGISGAKSDAARCGCYFNVGGNDVDIVYGHGKSSFMFGGGNTFSEKTVWVADLAGTYSGWGSDAYSHRLIDGTVETLNRLSGTYFHKQMMQIFSQNGGEAILHLKGTQSDVTSFWLRPTVSVIWDPTGDFTQAFSNRLHDTTGFIEVRGGTVASTGTNSFPCLSRLIVRKGATFKVADTCPAVFGETPTVNVYLETGATLDVPAGSTFKVGALVVDGAPVAAGDHTSISGVTFTGAKVSVARTPADTEWTGAADGKFATTGNWTFGVPSATLAGRIEKAGTYAVAIEDATTVGDLVVASSNGQATVSASAAVTVGGTLTLGSPFAGADGVYEQTAGSLTATAADAKIALGNGGTLRLNGGNAIVSNALVMTGGALELSGSSRLDYRPRGAKTQRYFATGSVLLEGTSVLNAGASSNAHLYLTPDTAGGDLNVEVKDNAHLNFCADCTYFNVSSGSDFRGTETTLEVSGSGRVTLGNSAKFGSGTDTTGELVLKDNAYVCNTYWSVHIGGVGGTEVLNPAWGVARISGGCLCCYGGENSDEQCLGVGVGTRKANTGEAANVGELYLSGGVVSNVASSVFAVGYGDASGKVIQTGGAVVSRPNNRANSHNLIGFRGGEGYYEMSGGTFDSNRSVYVGGCARSDIGRTFTDYLKNDLPAKGTLKLLGGEFKTEQDLILAKSGEGTLVLGKDAKLRVAGNLDAQTGAKLVVDVSDWDGERSRTLATFGGTTTAFADENIEVIGELPAGKRLSITATRIRLMAGNGSMVIVR